MQVGGTMPPGTFVPNSQLAADFRLLSTMAAENAPGIVLFE
jgi:hypothetical protein